jgi:serine/threonine protein kinase/tetratricopeptide (TPR) repeat protein
MGHSSPSGHDSPASGTLHLERFVDDFEEAWQSGTPPRIEQFLPPRAESPHRRDVLEELIKIDLEYRWRQAPLQDAGLPPPASPGVLDRATALGPEGLPQHARLEDYVACYPELGPLEQLSADLIGEEYVVRQQWGDRPGQAEYLDRFPQQAKDLQEKLTRLDAEITPELAQPQPARRAGTGSEVARTDSRPEIALPASPASTLVCPSCGKRIETAAVATVRVEEPALSSRRHLAKTGEEEPFLPGYVILGELGRGGMGVVYKARHMSLQRLVALKMIRPELAGTRELQRFRREAEAVAQLHHPHIVQVYEVGELAGRPYISLEYVEGGSLAQKLAGTPQPVKPAAHLMEVLARAVQVAHQRGIIHRDLKPGNVLLARSNSPQAVSLDNNAGEETYEPKLTDFGLAKRLDQETGQTQTGEIMGTPSYMAPEQASGRTQDIGPAVDVYALGAILYELLTGQPPFRGATTLDTLDLVRTQEPVPPRRLQPKLPRDLETICLKCLQKEPHQRYTSAEALAEDLRRFRTGEPIQARPVGSVERAWRWCRRKPLVASLTAALVLVFLLGFAGVLWQWRLAEEQRTLAEQSFREERQVVDEYLIKITESEQLKDPGLAALRKDLLRGAQKYHQGFLERRGRDPALQAEIATTYSRLASIHLQNREFMEATQFAHEALQLRQRLVDAHPTSIPLRRDLAASYDQLATVQGYAGQTTAPLDNFQQARALGERLVQESPDDPELQDDLARTYMNTGLVQRRLGQRTEALDSHQQAGEIWARLVHFYPTVAKYKLHLAKNYGSIANARYDTEPDLALRAYGQALNLFIQLTGEHPGVFEYEKELAATHHNIGWLLYQNNELAQALQSNESARQIREKLVRNTMVSLQNELARSYHNIGMLQRDAGQAAPALESFQQARAIREQLIQRPPENPFFRSDLGATLGELGQVMAELGRRQDALTVYQQAVKHQQEAVAKAPKIVEFQQRLLEHYLGLAAVQRDLGRSVEANSTLQAFQKSASGQPEVLYKVAHNLALRASRVGGGKENVTPEERAEQRRYGDQVVQALQEAHAQGFRDLKRLQQEPLFESLRPREDFQKLLKQLAQATPSAAEH